jgi:PAP2 superfamily
MAGIADRHPGILFFPADAPPVRRIYHRPGFNLALQCSTKWQDMITATIYAGYIGLGAQIQALLIRLFPKTIDLVLLRADHRFLFDPITFAHTLSRHNFVMVPVVIGYNLLPAIIGAVWVAERDRLTRRAIVISGILCWVPYAIFPAVGPSHYNWATGTASPLSPRNCVPSMHLTWAILLAWNARSLPFRMVLWGYAALIALATIVGGEHYLVDLIAALPYTALVQWASSVDFGRLLSHRRHQAFGQIEPSV